MRNLTIKRAKRFVACLGTMKVYIEDPTANDLTINGCPCRFLGKLKNGGQQTFTIGEDAAKVFVIADKLSKGYCSEFYPLSEGEADVTLTGKNCFNPAAGNAFRFDGVADEAVLKNRKRGTKVGWIVLLIAAIIGFAIGFGATYGLLFGPAEPKTFAESGIEITLTDDFEPISVEKYTLSYESRDVAVFVLKESRLWFENVGVTSLTDYSKVVQQANNHDYPVHKDDSFLYYEYRYTNPDTGEEYHYFTTMHKSAFHFWIVQFATPEEKAEDYRQTILEWARSVEVE